MAIPDYQTLMLPVLRASVGQEVNVGQLAEPVAKQLGLTSEDRAQLIPSGGFPTFNNRLHWAKTYLSKAGLLRSTRRGYFTATERGEEVVGSGVKRIDNKFLSRFEEFIAFKQRSRPKGTAAAVQIQTFEADNTPQDAMRLAHIQINTVLAQELLDRIRNATPSFFERLVVDLLLRMGFGGSAERAGRAIGGSGDGGVDGVIDQDPLGLDRVYVQAKRYANGNNVSSGAIRDFFGSLDRHKAAKGLFVTTSSFTKDAQDTAALLSKRIVLLDGEALAELMIKYDLGCRIEETFSVKKVDEEFFEL